MIRIFLFIMMGAVCLLVSSCAEQDRPDAAADEDWSDIQALDDDAEAVPAGSVFAAAEESVPAVQETEFEQFARQLAQMQASERRQGETMLSGESLVFDYEQQVVQMDHDVVVLDDRGTLEAERLVARFSSSNNIQQVKATGGVKVRNEGRVASADEAVYHFQSGALELQGKAAVSGEGSRVFGERIRFWSKGDRRVICEPNALFIITDASELPLGDFRKKAPGDTEIRADRVVYNESDGLAELKGHVRLRDPHVAMDCGNVRVFLKEAGEIDWIEAEDEVIIRAGESDVRAVADQAVYHVGEGKFMLEGTPMIKSGMNVMTGDRISFWHGTRQMICEPNARVLLYLDEETRAKFTKDLDD